MFFPEKWRWEIPLFFNSMDLENLTPQLQSSAQNWPVRPILFIVSFAAGGTPGIPCRLVTERIGSVLGQQIFVENLPAAARFGATPRAAPSGPEVT
jgi:tripartite-type tricarboxylate transporter receptor subunit TctC